MENFYFGIKIYKTFYLFKTILFKRINDFIINISNRIFNENNEFMSSYLKESEIIWQLVIIEREVMKK